jgi:hypothetical protein
MLEFLLGDDDRDYGEMFYFAGEHLLLRPLSIFNNKNL